MDDLGVPSFQEASICVQDSPCIMDLYARCHRESCRIVRVGTSMGRQWMTTMDDIAQKVGKTLRISPHVLYVFNLWCLAQTCSLNGAE